ncbi:MAG: class I SAM-dependent methyltransferase [Opitutales bacterium]|nr:class I SAM-dependent methyltransferase [Opitutales bacterium]
MLSPVHIREISTKARSYLLKILKTAGISWVRANDIKDAQKTFIEIESEFEGRIAGPIEEYILLYILARDVGKRFKDKPCHIVEIGTLFGGSSILIWRALQKEEASIPIVTIDPLDGYYKDENTGSGSDYDIVLKLKITEELVRKNFKSFSIPEEDITIVKDLSQNQGAIQAASVKSVALLFIDGDHSLMGIRRDLENYIDLVDPKGFLAIDNFLDVDWPQVTEGILTNLDVVKSFSPILSHSKILVLNHNKEGFFKAPIIKSFLSEAGDFINLFRQRASHLRQMLNNDLENILKQNLEGVNTTIAKTLDEGKLEAVPTLGKSNDFYLQTAPILLTFADALKEKSLLLAQIEDQNKGLQSSLEEEQKNYTSILEKGDSLFAALVKVNDSLKSSQSTFENQCIDFENRLKALVIDKDKSNQQLEEEKKLNKKLVVKSAKLETQIKGLETTLKERKSLTVSKDKEIKIMIATVSKKEAKIQELSSSNRSNSRKIDSQTKEIEKLNHRIERLEQQVADFDARLKEKTMRYESLEEHEKDLKLNLELLNEDITYYQKSIALLKEMCSQISTREEEAKVELSKTLEEKEEITAQFERTNSTQEARIQDLSNRSADQSKNIEQLESQKDRLIFELKTYVGELRNREEELKLFKVH